MQHIFSWRVKCNPLSRRFAVSMSYYGLSFTADQLTLGDLFTNFLLSMSMDVPANILCLVLLDRWGRRRLHTVSTVVGGLACLAGVLSTMVAPKGENCQDYSS